MMKKIYLILISIISCITASAYDVVVDGIYYTLDDENHSATVTYKYRYSSQNVEAYIGDVVVPESITLTDTIVTENIGEDDDVSLKSDTVFVTNTYSVIAVAQRAFYDCSNLTSLVLPSTIQTIGDDVFNGCTNLISVNIPEGVTALKNASFFDCSSLTDISLPSTLTTIGKSAFLGCTSLRHIDIPSGVTSIGECAFNETPLVSIKLPESLTSLGYKAFMDCPNLEEIVIPDLLKMISVSVFNGCSSLSYVELGNSVDTLNVSCFADCPKLTKVVLHSYPSLTYGNAFSNCPVSVYLVPNTIISTFAKHYPWKSYKNINPIQCETPTIYYENGTLQFATDTNLSCSDDTESYVYNIEVSDVNSDDTEENVIDMLTTYDITAYAKVRESEDSEMASVSLCWLNTDPELTKIDPTTSIADITTRKAVLFESNNGEVSVTGLSDGENLSYYSTDGRLLGSTSVCEGKATLHAQSGQVIIVRFAGKGARILVK